MANCWQIKYEVWLGWNIRATAESKSIKSDFSTGDKLIIHEAFTNDGFSLLKDFNLTVFTTTLA